jgi:hypothetical protein
LARHPHESDIVSMRRDTDTKPAAKTRPVGAAGGEILRSASARTVNNSLCGVGKRFKIEPNGSFLLTVRAGRCERWLIHPVGLKIVARS